MMSDKCPGCAAELGEECWCDVTFVMVDSSPCAVTTEVTFDRSYTDPDSIKLDPPVC